MQLLSNIRTKVTVPAALFVLASGFATVVAAPMTYANSEIIRGGKAAANREQEAESVSSAIVDITNLLLFALGAVSVIMIIIGGVRFATSNGNAEQIKQAKNIILYAVIGLVVAIMAYAIVEFVVTSL